MMIELAVGAVSRIVCAGRGGRFKDDMSGW